MSALVPDETDTPETDPEGAAYALLRGSVDPHPDLQAVGYALLALVREQKRTNKILSSYKTPPTIKPSKKP